MPPVTRKDVDLHTPHDACPPTLLVTGSGDTFVNSHGVGRVGDVYIPHGCTNDYTVGVVGGGIGGGGAMTPAGETVAIVAPPINSAGDGHELHVPIIASGSPDTFVNSRPVARVGDAVNCGCNVASGSPDTFVNG